MADRTSLARPPGVSRLDLGNLPVEALALLGQRESRRPNPIYGAHRWFARRLGTAMRALLVAYATTPESDFWAAFEGGADATGLTVLDPFLGGGTGLVEAQRMGAKVIGGDIDPVACAVSSFQLDAPGMPDLDDAIAHLKATVGSALRPLHVVKGPEGEEREVVHWFWVQMVDCRRCGTATEAHPHFRLAISEDKERQWAFCRACHSVRNVAMTDATLACEACGEITEIEAAPAKRGKFTCPSCGETERLIDLAERNAAPPSWRLFASESIKAGASHRESGLAGRLFLPAGEQEAFLYRRAQEALAQRRDDSGAVSGVPNEALPEGPRADDRLQRYGYRRTGDLFNDRQMLHLSLLAEALAEQPAAVRRALAIAFSDHLTTNCMLTGYAFGWRRLSPLFAIRGYRHMVRPVEINPWLDGVGRGTYPNAVRQVQRAIDEARAPRTLSRADVFAALPQRAAPRPEVRCADARDLRHVPRASVDLVLTDPPYMDYVAYGELADFYRPWLEKFGLLSATPAGSSLALVGRDEDARDEFEAGLRGVMLEIARVLKPSGRVTFTFRHDSEGAYHALAAAIGSAGLRAVTVFPLKGDGNFGLHAHPGTTSWDGVFVLARGGRRGLADNVRDSVAAKRHVEGWATRLRAKGLEFGAADEAALLRASLASASLGAFDR